MRSPFENKGGRNTCFLKQVFLPVFDVLNHYQFANPKNRCIVNKYLLVIFNKLVVCKTKYYIRLLLTFLALTSRVGYAQKTYRFESITVNEGLSQSSVTSIAQDALGYLWIGTQDGLNKYDGYSIKVYRNKEGDSTSLAKNYVSKILVDNQNTIWIATLGHLSKYNLATDGFTNYQLAVAGVSISPNVFIWDIFHGRDGRLVLSTTTGLIHFDPSTGKFQVEKEFLSSFGKVVYSYYETRSKGAWIFLMRTILHRAPGSKDWNSKQIVGHRSYYDKHSDQLFCYVDVSGKSSLLKYDSSGIWVEWTAFEKHLLSLEICFTSSGNIWVATDSGIFIYEPSGRLQTSIKAIEISTTDVNQAKAICESRDGVIWLGTNGYGLKKYNPQTNQFNYVGSSATSSMHLSHAYVDAIYTDDDTTLYVTTPNGLDVLNLVTKSFRQFPQQARIRRIVRDQGQLWLCGTEDLLLFKSNQFIDTHLHNIDKITPYPASRMAFAGDGKIYLLDHGKKEYLLKQPSLTDITALHIIGDTLWVGTGPGTSQVKVFNFRTRQLLIDFSNDPLDNKSLPSGGGIKCIFQDSKKRIWIGSTAGLIRYNSVEKNFVHFTEKDGLPNNTIYGILEDDQHNFWLSTNKGLCEFNPETKKIRNFEAFDGLQSNEFNTGAVFKSKSGTMYFGGVNGVTYFNPKEISTSSSIPQSAISGFYVDNKLISNYSDYISEDKGKDTPLFSLQYTERDFGFDVVSIGFSLPGRIHYRYMLENYDHEWQAIGNIRHVSFTNIPPGDYKFKVQSSDPYGNWEAKGATVALAIHSPFWRRSGVWITAAFAIFFITLSIYYLRIRQLKNRASALKKIVDARTMEIQKQKEEIATQNEELLQQAIFLEEKNKELEKAKGLLEIEMKYLHQRQLLKSSIDVQEEERKRIAQDLHDELGAVLSIARMHLVQIQEQQGKGVDLNSGLQQARTLTESALATMRRISHELMPPQLEKFGLVKTLQAIVTHTNAVKQIDLELRANDDLPRWSMPVELGLYRVCMEMINNTLKHAHAKNIRIQLKQYANEILYVYEDDGHGLPENYTSGHGFKNIEARVNIMGGTITMGNHFSGGFHASLTMPVPSGSSITV